MDTEKLLEIARFLNLTNVESELIAIQNRSNQPNVNLILPLVGEFSSGKTTLINAITDSKKLETATKPTTTTIFEVHFSADRCYATVVDKNGEVYEVNDIAELKNDELVHAKVVTVFDSSLKVPQSTILVDTPGLSSPTPEHKQTLINFLPQADGILLVSDINQQITRSLTDFIDTMKLSKRPIFLILTKCDTKSPQEIEDAKKYISENCQIPLKQLVVVSAATGNLDEFYSLLHSIEKDKRNIIQKVDTQRINNINDYLLEQVEDLMNSSQSDKELDESIRKCQYELDKISRNIERLIDSTTDDLDSETRAISRKFEDLIFTKLNTLVTGKSTNFDNEAISIINATASLLLNEYKTNINNVLNEKIKRIKDSNEGISLCSFDVDMSQLQLSGLSYNLNLNNIGHEYDGWIKTGVIAVAAVGTVAAMSSTGALSTIKSAATIDNVIDVADTVTDVGSIVSNKRSVNRMQKFVNMASNASEKYNTFVDKNQQLGQQSGSDKGMIDSMVGFITDKLMSKPQRVRLIRNYIDSSLSPEFMQGLQNMSQSLVSNIKINLENGVSEVLQQKNETLSLLKKERNDKKELFEQRINQLRIYKTELLTL